MEELLRNKVKEAASQYFDEICSEKKELSYIPASGKLLCKDDLLHMIDASLDMWLTSGRFNDEFENKLAKFLGTKFVLTTNSGSSANLLALSALTSYKLGERALKKGDEVITVAAGFPTTVNPIIQLGLVPVFVDCKIGTYNIDEELVENAITTKTKAIFIAHTLGNSFNLDKIKEICNKYNLWLIEDSCDALGGEYHSRKLGTIGDIGTFSFYPAHHITMGEGGAVATNNLLLKKILMSFRDWGRDCSCPPGSDGICKKRFSQQLGKLPFGYDHKYTYSHIGYNLKITDWQAALGCSQLDKLELFLKKRRENAMILMDNLSDLRQFFILPTVQEHCNPSWFGFLISVRDDAPFSKQSLVEYLEQNNIGTRQLFAGNILRQPMFVNNNIDIRIGNSALINSSNLTDEHFGLLPNTEFIMNNTFWVGVFPTLSKDDILRISNVIHSFVKEVIGE